MNQDYISLYPFLLSSFTEPLYHINAFNFFGGAPEVIKLDNLKAGVLDANFYEPLYQKEYKRLADHYGCLLFPCRPYQPQEKGKVESGVKYVKNNFFAGREFVSNKEMNMQLAQWMERTNNRIHGTTKAIPAEAFHTEEVPNLKKLPIEQFTVETPHIRTVAKDCHITIDNNYYSVPAKYISQDVIVSLGLRLIKIYHQDTKIATHARSSGKGVFTTDPNHYPESKRYSPGFAEYEEKCQAQMSSIGTSCAKLLVVLKREHSKDWHRTIKGIVRLRKLYSDEIIEQAVQRALSYGISSYGKIKKILETNSYNLPLEMQVNNEADHANAA